jgi:CRISPR-associated protein (TIGR03986 family)
MTQYIKAPFNFVPLNEKVFFPEWAGQVSHDIPFSDGESGEIELELEALTPVFVRNGHIQADAEAKNDDYVSFSKDADGNYFIPGTSVKGMIRNVLEIMSFGKMNQISNDQYGFRDLQNNKDYMSLFQGGKVLCGFMKKINHNEVEIVDHGIPYRISQKEIDRYFQSSLSNFCSTKDKLKRDSDRTAKKKYDLLHLKQFEYRFQEDNQIHKPKVDTRKFVKFNVSGSIKGTIVLTGQPNVRQKIFNRKQNKTKWIGKFYEFVFSLDNKAQPEKIPISDEKDLRFKDFLFIHKDSSDWKNFRKKQFDNYEAIPVFFVKDESGKILHFGLSYLYKIPYKKRVKDCLYNNHKKDAPDFADLIFGNQNLGLKGRLQFSHAKLLSGVIDEKMEPLMGSPKASYYPIYLQQNCTNGYLNDKFYQTYSSINPILRGWKRFPLHDNETRTFQTDEKQKKNTSPFVPLMKGSKFSFRIRFHNLRPEEIGGLLLAINLNESRGFHSIGFAKSYGFGKIKLTIKDNSDLHKLSRFTNSFKKAIEKVIPGWANSNQIFELIEMSKSAGNDKNLNYMNLSEFADAKSESKNFGNKLVLPYFSEYIKKEKSYNQSSYNKPLEIKLHSHQKSNPPKPVIQEKLDTAPKVEIQPDWKKGTIISNKKVKLLEMNLEVAMVIPIGKRNILFNIGDKVWVKTKQLKKDGTINQVEFITKE